MYWWWLDFPVVKCFPRTMKYIWTSEYGHHWFRQWIEGLYAETEMSFLTMAAREVVILTTSNVDIDIFFQYDVSISMS